MFVAILGVLAVLLIGFVGSLAIVELFPRETTCHVWRVSDLRVGDCGGAYVAYNYDLARQATYGFWCAYYWNTRDIRNAMRNARRRA